MAGEPILLNQGQNTNLPPGSMLDVIIQCSAAPSALDISCFMVNDEGKVPSDEYFIFYNQNVDPHQCVQLVEANEQHSRFQLDLNKLLQTPVSKCVFTATLEGTGTFAQVSGCQAVLQIGGQQITYTLSEVTAETALILIEVYKYKDSFKVRAIGRGFFGGLQPLAESFGVEIESSDTSQPQAEASTTAPSVAPAAASHPSAGIPSSAAAPSSAAEPPAPKLTTSLTKIDLLKKKVTLSLQKKNVSPIQARVAVVFDASGSMYSLYKKGIVQEAFERVLAIAAAFDDNGELDVWFFAKDFLRARSVRAEDYENYVERAYKLGSKGGTNNEPPVMEDVIRKYTKEEPNVRIPTYIIFFSDGGVSSKSKIAKLIIDSSRYNLFWQFVGLGNANYGVLRELDDLKGRFVDNANFFELDDISKVSDEELYDRLLSEFPSWIEEARRKSILA
ncbi:VWA domain-containing protein [Paenibacillus bovis]|uniref:Tellurium resistance protein TerF n=1 Tax=Paenibacillus bovis TaxID=1616788 RepID=A0A172ZJR7_9BACL|nr:VWA domain-containing protein [Paenibacillus bovis]ANF97884.1 tellurium resistance protein TerF [Paenibacillus bovis]